MRARELGDAARYCLPRWLFPYERVPPAAVNAEGLDEKHRQQLCGP